ncbi:hypothetical protein ZMO02_10010 [Zymomonas mobilis subsp. pomaceae]|nr:hypothetical protein ZMO02_10010 [Zymomonas mobilis subsp. pomaceae]
MSVQEFINKAKSLKRKGPFALVSPDYDLLSDIGRMSDKAWKAQLAKKPKPACPPSTDISIGDDEFMGFLKAIPPKDRNNTTVIDAYIKGMNSRYPCRNNVIASF